MCGKVYGIAQSTTSITVRELFSAIKKHLKPLVIPKLIKDKIKEITASFENLHGIPYILRAIDGSHILIVKLLLKMVNLFHIDSRNCKCKVKFWDYDYGWLRSIHD
jgi:hypothetical protein